MCSWCYGFSRSLHEVIAALPEGIEFRRLLGGLAADTDEPMPEQLRRHVQDNWHRIERSIPGVVFNHDFWSVCEPRRSTYMSCRAVIAARQLESRAETDMIHAIQHAYYQQARNPSNVDSLVQLADEIDLDGERFRELLLAESTDEELQSEIDASRSMYVEAYPSLRLVKGDELVSIQIDYNDAGNILQQL